MPPIEMILAAAVMIALNLYALTGGADYGGGVWDLLARGLRAGAQRELIARAIGPIWEADHIWLILVLVLMFTAFPQTFATITTALHIPLAAMVVGIVLRGSAFAFRSHGVSKQDRGYRQWGRAFAIASLVTPVLLGLTLGAIASGQIERGQTDFWGRFVGPWLAPFPFAVGLLTLVLFAFLAAVYLILETEDPELRQDFRFRALVSGALVGVMALIVAMLARSGAPSIWHGLHGQLWTWPMHLAAAGGVSGAVILALWTRRFRMARICAGLLVTLILWGWAIAQFPVLVEPDITIHNAAAPPATLRMLLGALIAGALVLFPSFYYLFRIFKRTPALR
jgi:cytochrome d ubiquinol oxidase subunit II